MDGLRHRDENKEEKRREEKRAEDGSEWVAGQKPHPVRLRLSRPPGPRGGGGTAGRKRLNRGERA